MFAEYTVTYVEVKEGVPPLRPRQPGEDSFDTKKGKFARRLDNIREAKPELTLPYGALKRIWDDVGDAVHPPDGLSERDIGDHKHNYQVKAKGVVKDALTIARWLKARYKTMGPFARLKYWWQSKRRDKSQK